MTKTKFGEFSPFRRGIIFYVLCCLPGHGLGDMTPVCRYSTGRNGSIVGGVKYRIGDAYKAADLVVVGRAVEEYPWKLGNNIRGTGQQRLLISHWVKGRKKPKEVSLVGWTYEGTEGSGLSLPIEKDYLLLLRQVSPGVFDSVDITGGKCPNAFEVNGGEVKIGERRLKIGSLKVFFESNPEPISFQ
jgi:hypothetical protein